MIKQSIDDILEDVKPASDSEAAQLFNVKLGTKVRPFLHDYRKKVKADDEKMKWESYGETATRLLLRFRDMVAAHEEQKATKAVETPLQMPRKVAG